MENLDWFNTLNKPFLNPPSEIFTPVWTILYIMMGLSLIIFVRTGITRQKQTAIILFITQLTLNLLWTPMFFWNKNILGAFVIIILLLIFIVLTILSFYKYSKPAALLLVPYLIWVTFATYLNWQFLILN